jgi:hypothetical protein
MEAHDDDLRKFEAGDISSIQGHIVPTALAYDGETFLVGNLDLFPIRDGSSKIMSITPQGSVTTVDINLTIIVGLAYDSQSRLYVLENTTGNLFPTPARERCCASLRSILLPRSLRACLCPRQ